MLLLAPSFGIHGLDTLAMKLYGAFCILLVIHVANPATTHVMHVVLGNM
jgi:hypothetical protein